MVKAASAATQKGAPGTTPFASVRMTPQVVPK